MTSTDIYTLASLDYKLYDVTPDGSCLYKSLAVSMLCSFGKDKDDYGNNAYMSNIDAEEFYSTYHASVIILARWLKYYVHVILYTKVLLENIYFDAGILDTEGIMPIYTTDKMEQWAQGNLVTNGRIPIPSIMLVIKWLTLAAKRSKNDMELFKLHVEHIKEPFSDQRVCEFMGETPLVYADILFARAKFQCNKDTIGQMFESISIDMMQNAGVAQDLETYGNQWQETAFITQSYDFFAGHTETLLLRWLIQQNKIVSNSMWDKIVVVTYEKKNSKNLCTMDGTKEEDVSPGKDLIVLLSRQHYSPVVFVSD